MVKRPAIRCRTRVCGGTVLGFDETGLMVLVPVSPSHTRPCQLKASSQDAARGGRMRGEAVRRQRGADAHVWKWKMQQGPCGHLMGERRECAHSGDADGSEDAEDHSALPRLVFEVGIASRLGDLVRP